MTNSGSHAVHSGEHFTRTYTKMTRVVTALRSTLWAWNGLPQIHIFQCMLERTDAITNEVLEPITFVLAHKPHKSASDKTVAIDNLMCLAGQWIDTSETNGVINMFLLATILKIAAECLPETSFTKLYGFTY